MALFIVKFVVFLLLLSSCAFPEQRIPSIEIQPISSPPARLCTITDSFTISFGWNFFHYSVSNSKPEPACIEQLNVK